MPLFGIDIAASCWLVVVALALGVVILAVAFGITALHRRRNRSDRPGGGGQYTG